AEPLKWPIAEKLWNDAHQVFGLYQKFQAQELQTNTPISAKLDLLIESEQPTRPLVYRPLHHLRSCPAVPYETKINDGPPPYTTGYRYDPHAATLVIIKYRVLNKFTAADRYGIANDQYNRQNNQCSNGHLARRCTGRPISHMAKSNYQKAGPPAA